MRILLTTLLLATALVAQDADTWVARGDSAYAAFDNRAALDAYRSALALDSSRIEATWKLARAYVDVGEILPEKEARADFYQNARIAADRAIALDSTSAKAWLFRSIALGRVALDAGAKERVQLSKDVRDAVQRSLVLDSTDAVAWHVLGRWHRKLATLSWIEKRFANIFLGGVPKEASVEEAARCFQRAAALEPHGLSHVLELGITWEALDEKEKAAEAYRKVLSMTVTDSDDPGRQEEARRRLGDL